MMTSNAYKAYYLVDDIVDTISTQLYDIYQSLRNVIAWY
jgi:hypothetical protein